MAVKRILLVEPGYRNKYPPLGLMKLASYHRSKGHYLRFAKVGFDSGSDPLPLMEKPWDRVYVTTLFSFEWARTAAAIDEAVLAAGMQTDRVFVGGIAASLMRDAFVEEPRWAGVRFIQGLLDGPPAAALQLNGSADFGAGDIAGTPIEQLVPDYSILAHSDYVYPVRDAYFGYASRGCVRKCAFCGVPKLEGAQREMPPLEQLVRGISEKHGEKKDLVLMDNNITASARYREVIAEICDLGFTPGAVIPREGGRSQRRRVDFNQGVDARILAKSPMYLQEMSKICISPLRIAFDHMGVHRVYDTAVRMAAQNQITSLSNYMLYNFMDRPDDLYRRMRINIELNEELGIRIWSFPMRYQPVTLKDRSHVGKHWNRYFLRSFQIMLQATHGVVSGNPSFFTRAYGDTEEEFQHLLTLPHAFIFHRQHYEAGEGSAVRGEYESIRGRMSESQVQELVELLSGPQQAKKLSRENYARLTRDRSVDRVVREAIRFHILDTKDRLDEREVSAAFSHLNPDPVLPTEEEFVEDAGLFDDSVADGEETGVSERRSA